MPTQLRDGKNSFGQSQDALQCIHPFLALIPNGREFLSTNNITKKQKFTFLTEKAVANLTNPYSIMILAAFSAPSRAIFTNCFALLPQTLK